MTSCEIVIANDMDLNIRFEIGYLVQVTNIEMSSLKTNNHNRMEYIEYKMEICGLLSKTLALLD